MSTLLKWLVTFYIVSILAWSGMLKAQVIILDQVHFSPMEFKLRLDGEVASKCGISIVSKIIENQFTEEEPLLIIELQNTALHKACVPSDSLPNSKFSSILDIRTLGLKPGNSYQIAFANDFKNHQNPYFKVTLPQNAISSNYKFNTLEGTVAKDRNDRIVLIQNENEKPLLLQSEIDLSAFLGHSVIIEFFEILHRTGPHFEVDQNIPLRDDLTSNEDSTMFVLSILDK